MNATIHRRFDNRPIRDFVPVFVERIAREELRHSSR
ncbi:three-helix bundle dimerization domain-containing protein [Streptosporangium sp. 'caverna']